MAGVIGMGSGMQSSALKGLLSASQAEAERNIMNDRLHSEAVAADKSRTMTAAGIGAYAAPKLAGMMAGSAPVAGATAAGTAVGTTTGTAAGTAATEAGVSAAIPGLGWVAAAGLGIYAIGSLFDWW